MAKVWVMKVYVEWFDNFAKDNIIGIDEDCVNKDYTTYNESQLQKLFKEIPRRKVFFDRMIQDVNEGDVVIVGIGQTTKFNIAALATVQGDYEFAPNQSPRHLRKVKILKVEEPISYDKWGWARRLEEITTDRMGEFAEVISLINNTL